ncbi:hypothetical protein BATDEDRAFT_24715 [Batrachochytrium dendrobatidis JAM81]|uniref:NodB homology domain-containing protein n=1 Tax=Batrachochytrium dendrobatidis (strain JAM81 / FGSC 10211) TaxID=684364 RepID=F4P265_BATDJ|nr:uncharacterized protein BATDEDRAFT_24715 [Batrachochytrium dendrobatidis JAM81]EGF80802.1 hypothetical protein BATDEDRAFT_24715 [Batrachochytrium dendrobatidis JAM81]|eukprot:XP_006678522.1 hypothetical protein BATDEDRAFT_24715 [Batrachochytrium dendrobatidis JAM81]
MLMLKVSVLAFAAVCSAQVLPKSAPFVTSNDGILNLPVSSDLKCGPKAKTICPDDLCCSEYGVCNRETDSCGKNCQRGYGHCEPEPSKTQEQKDKGAEVSSKNLHELVLKSDKCGPKHGRCKGSLCCSDRGYCGVDVSHCISQCNPLYGECGNDLSPAIKASLTLTDDNTCGRRYNKVCPPESCCSRDGECGTSTAHCSVGCQGLFGICKLPITKPPTFDLGPPDFEYYDEIRKKGRGGGRMALAFDGGTDVHNVPKILDVLKELDVQATFFVSGFKTSNLYDSEVQAIVKRICDEGHQVGSGSLSYSRLGRISPEEVALEMLNNDWMIQKVIGASPLYMRLPHGDTSPEVIKQLMEMGYIVVGSNLDSYDLSIGDVNDSGETALANFDKGHDGFPTSDIQVKSHITLNHEDVKNNHLGIRKIIEKYRKIGYKFITVGECLSQPDPQSWYRVRDFNEFA